jgi:hypothetical protein
MMALVTLLAVAVDAAAEFVFPMFAAFASVGSVGCAVRKPQLHAVWWQEAM